MQNCSRSICTPWKINPSQYLWAQREVSKTSLLLKAYSRLLWCPAVVFRARLFLSSIGPLELEFSVDGYSQEIHGSNSRRGRATSVFFMFVLLMFFPSHHILKYFGRGHYNHFLYEKKKHFFSYKKWERRGLSPWTPAVLWRSPYIGRHNVLSLRPDRCSG